jgi:hypothetical protein
MSLRWMYDAADPPADPPPWHVAAGYIGGDTPHVWTPEQWRAQPVPYLLPIWSASDREDTACAAGQDAWDITLALAGLGVPHEATVAVDIEEAVYTTYLAALSGFLDPRPVLAYGSMSTLLRNRRPSGGFWAGDWTDRIGTGIQLVGTDGLRAVQWASAQMLGKPWDQSVIEDTVPLWKHP